MMFARRRQHALNTQRETALVLRAPDEMPYRMFPSEIVNNFRYLLTRLRYDATSPATHSSCIALVSALRQEGVTYTALALATTLAHDLDASVCVIDLNWGSPGLPAALTPPPLRRRWWKRRVPQLVSPDLPQSGGLAALLCGTATLDEALLATATPNLSLLPAGALPLSQRPVVARSGQLRTCIDTLMQRFDYVLLDVPAVLTTSDAIALASLAQACCVVVRQGVTPVHSVRAALDDLKHLPMLGVILNQASVATPRWITALVPQE